MLQIANLHVTIDNEKILKGVNLTIKPGKVHALMGPNGSGKSTLAFSLMGKQGCRIEKGKLKIGRKLLNSLEPEDRAKLGLFLAFQQPREVPGLSITSFLRQAKNTLTGKPLPVSEFIKEMKKTCKLLGLPESFLARNLNEGFSGGEKKKCEILQMAILSPKYAILDEIDSGLDIDSLKKIAKGIKKIAQEKKIGILVITHYQRILKYLKPDQVHVMIDGKIAESGDSKLAKKIDKKGYVQG